MLRVAVMVSGGGTNLQAIIDAVKDGTITNTELVAVISNNAGEMCIRDRTEVVWKNLDIIISLPK